MGAKEEEKSKERKEEEIEKIFVQITYVHEHKRVKIAELGMQYQILYEYENSSYNNMITMNNTN